MIVSHQQDRNTNEQNETNNTREVKVERQRNTGSEEIGHSVETGTKGFYGSDQNQSGH